MEYLPPKVFVKKFWKSLKTIYNRINRHEDKIRIKNEFWKKLIHCNDFEKVFFSYNPVQNDYKEVTKWVTTNEAKPQSSPNIEITNDVAKWITKDFVTLQNNYNYSIQKIEDLQKHNSTLSHQIKEYALLFTEEKKEKKDLHDKLESLHEKYNQKVEAFTKEKIKLSNRQFLLIGITIVSFLIIARLMLPSILEKIENSKTFPTALLGEKIELFNSPKGRISSLEKNQ